MSSSTALRALSGYRRLFRARKQLFAGDKQALRESRFAIRAEFDKNRAITGPTEHIEGLLTMIDEAEDMLLHGIVRGELNQDRNVIEVRIGPEHESRMDTETMTHIDPITSETGAKIDGAGKPKIEVTKSSGSSPAGD
jgi:complex III assembly factor LYRM7